MFIFILRVVEGSSVYYFCFLVDSFSMGDWGWGFEEGVLGSFRVSVRKVGLLWRRVVGSLR